VVRPGAVTNDSDPAFLLVPFSCKGRGFGPSCGGRRMADRGAHLVDDVFRAVLIRQWVLTVIRRILRHFGVSDVLPEMRPSRAPPLPFDVHDDRESSSDY